MAKTIAYMITWTTYGTWLQGDERGFVKKGITYPPNEPLAAANRRTLKKSPVTLTPTQRTIAHDAIVAKATQLNHILHALHVACNHIHLVIGFVGDPIGSVVSTYKNAAQVALRSTGLTGRIWTKGFDKRYCFDQHALNQRIGYVTSHNENQSPI
ncbi:MAG: transposase [Planctomycetota bacterium]|jgi:hypothetical protein